MTAPDSLFVQLQTALAGEYSLERELGRGGMGVVYLAREVRLAREVAIKVLPPEFAAQPERREQFSSRGADGGAPVAPQHRADPPRRRGRRIRLLRHGVHRGRNARPSESRSAARCRRIRRHVCSAKPRGRSPTRTRRGLVHRDIKADNILIERSTGRAVVTDFGIASAAHTDARNSDGMITGSPHYASPEQIAGQPVDAASDLYSLGVVGFFALTGRLPFDAPTVREVSGMHLTVRTTIDRLAGADRSVAPRANRRTLLGKTS